MQRDEQEDTRAEHFLEPRLEEERLRDGLNFRVNDEEDPELEVERRQKFGTFAAISAVAALVLGFYAFFRVLSADAATLAINSTIGWFALIALLAGVAMALVAVASFVSANQHQQRV